MIPSGVRRSDLVNKHIKRNIAIFVQLFRLKLKFKIHWLQPKFDSIKSRFVLSTLCCDYNIFVLGVKRAVETRSPTILVTPRAINIRAIDNSIPTILVTPKEHYTVVKTRKRTKTGDVPIILFL